MIGLMGSGKSSVGRALSRLLRWGFVDTDSAVEKTVRRSVRDIFLCDGETRFRALEKRAIAAASKASGRVIAVGGGAVLDAGNRRLMRRSGTVVYLQISPEAALRRLGKGGARARPLLAARDGKTPLAIMRRLLGKRRRLYIQCAGVKIRPGSDAPARVAERLLEKLKQ